MTRREWVLTAAVAAVAGAAGVGYRAWRGGDEDADEKAAAVLRATELPGLDGKPQTLRQWFGNVIVVNFWATWCAPCREEIPLFIRLQERYRARKLQFVGIAIDDAVRVKAYASELGMNFPVLVAGMAGIELTRALGNHAAVLPFSLAIARDVRITDRHVGAFKEAQLEAVLAPLLSA